MMRVNIVNEIHEKLFKDQRVDEIVDLFDGGEVSLQKALAKKLRVAVIDHLRNSLSDYARQFRRNYNNMYQLGSVATRLDDYLNKQAQEGAWATDVEAGALADLFKISVVISPLTKGVPQSPFRPCSDVDEERPVLCLYNRDNTHFYFYDNDSSQTVGDGNCLYNAFAQGLRQLYLLEAIPQNALIEQSLSIEHRRAISLQVEQMNKYSKSRVVVMRELLKEIANTNHPVLKSNQDAAVQVAVKEANDYTSLNSDIAFLKQKKIIRVKAEQLHDKLKHNPQYKNAAQAAVTLADALDKYWEEYKDNKNEMTYKNFKAKCSKAIKAAKPELEKHRGWKQVLVNLAMAILGLGIGYLAVGCVRKLSGRTFFWQVETDSLKKLKGVEESIEEIAPILVA